MAHADAWEEGISSLPSTALALNKPFLLLLLHFCLLLSVSLGFLLLLVVLQQEIRQELDGVLGASLEYLILEE